MLYEVITKDEASDSKYDFEHECRQFVMSASEHLSGIGVLKKTVPLDEFMRFSLKDLEWLPAVNEGGEDWFVITSYSIHYTKLYDGGFEEFSRKAFPPLSSLQHI